MITVTRSWTRPNTSVDWYVASVEYTQHVRQNYVDTNKRLSRTVADSTDGLTRTATTTWSDLAAFDEFRNDPVVRQAWDALVTDYNAAGVVIGHAIIV